MAISGDVKFDHIYSLDHETVSNTPAYVTPMKYMTEPLAAHPYNSVVWRDSSAINSERFKTAHILCLSIAWNLYLMKEGR